MSTSETPNDAIEESNYVPFLVLVFIALIFFIVTAKPTGYCKAEKRVISDDEICIKIWDGVIKNGHVQLQPSETSGEKYFLNHRSACVVDKSAMARFRQHGLLEAMFSDTINAGINYKMSDEFKKVRAVTGDRINSELIELSTCAEIRKSYGLVE